MNDFVAHTSTLLTSLQTTVTNFMAAERRHSQQSPRAPASCHPSADAAEQWAAAPADAPTPPVAPAVAAFRSFQLWQHQTAVQQAAAAAQAQEAARAAVPTEPSIRPQGLAAPAVQASAALAEVQLPPFSRRFSAQLSSGSGSPQQPAAQPTRAASQPQPDGAAAACSPGNRSPAGAENLAPQPRPLPAAMQSRLAQAAPCGSPAPCGNFQWRPCSASS